MPIRPENRNRYPVNWSMLRAEILRRAGARCECCGECGKDHHGRCLEVGGMDAQTFRGRVVLTIAHLDHNPENSDPDNLRAMCQACHNRYDKDHRAETRRNTRDAKQGQTRMPW